MTNAPVPETYRRRLLAVDDNRLILRVISDYFVPQGWEVTTADNVAMAREALAVAIPDVIVSDILMPEIDGWTFFEDVRKRKETSAIPFVFLTSESELPKRLRGLHLGADDYMTKPFAVEELEARIVRLLERSAAVKKDESSGTAAHLSGTLAHLAISDLLQILALNGKDGTVLLHRTNEDGRIEFVEGRIVDAQAGTARGTKALYRMLAWADANFRVTARDGVPPEPTITAGTSSLLMDGLVSLDDWARWSELLPGREARIELSDHARNRLQGEALAPVELDLVARAKSGISVARALEDSPHPDAEIAEAICTLVARGIVRAVVAGSEAETAPKR